MSLIKLIDVVKRYPTQDQTILNHVSLVVEEGEMLAIVGASGSGKSTLMNILGLLDKPDEGDYYLEGQSVLTMSHSELARTRNQCIGFVFQQFHLLPRLNALQNVALPLTYRPHLTAAETKQQSLEALERVGMQAFTTRCPTQLSGGQQQRVAIARALVGKPSVILADEPTGALDSATGQCILDLFHALNREGRTIILVTHDEHIAKQCHRRIVITDGLIAE